MDWPFLWEGKPVRAHVRKGLRLLGVAFAADARGVAAGKRLLRCAHGIRCAANRRLCGKRLPFGFL